VQGVFQGDHIHTNWAMLRFYFALFCLLSPSCNHLIRIIGFDDPSNASRHTAFEIRYRKLLNIYNSLHHPYIVSFMVKLNRKLAI
jgi:hypothetical protein